jgi:adenosine/AMP kinase
MALDGFPDAVFDLGAAHAENGGGHTTAGRGIRGVVDEGPPLGVESEADVAARKRLLGEIGYKL